MNMQESEDSEEMIRTALFDLDGTILDTSKGIKESVEYTIKKMGLCKLSDNELLSFIGPPLRQSFIANCGCSEEEAKEATRLFREYYQVGAVFHAKIYNGIVEAFKRLYERDIKMGVATNKPQRFAETLLKKYELNKYFMSICGADESGSQTKADLIQTCINRIEASKVETVLIGDTTNDAVGAAQAGISFLAVTYGFGFKRSDELKDIHSIGIADSPLQIADIILDEMDGSYIL